MESKLELHRMYSEQITKPISLPNDETVTEFIILDYHEISHGGPEYILQETIMMYCILGGGIEIRKCFKVRSSSLCEDQSLVEIKQTKAKLRLGRGPIGNFDRVYLD